MRTLHRFCRPCEKVVVVRNGQCPDCGGSLERGDRPKQRDVLGFREGFNPSLGTYVGSEQEMHNAAARIGNERYGYPIVMRKS